MTRNTKPKPTHDRIVELFEYDAQTGVFTRKQQARSWIGESRKHGKVGAGRISTLGYVMVGVDGVNYNAGALAWAYVHGQWPTGNIKYINGNKLDNRIENIQVQSLERGDVKDRKLTQERLKELLHYQPETGWFTWRVTGTGSSIGERAGGYHGLGYRSIGVDYKKFLEHTLAWLYMTGEWPSGEIDHKNHDKSDNRWENLKDGTKSENGHNKPLGRNGKVGYPGVYVHADKYRTRVHLNNETIDLGCHDTIAQARIARLLGERDYIGRFTTYIESRDGELPFFDKTISIKIENDVLFVKNKNEWVELSTMDQVNGLRPDD